MPGAVGRRMLHEDNKSLNRLGNSVEVLLMAETMVTGLDDFTTDDAKNTCACSGMKICEVEAIDARSNGNSNSDMRRCWPQPDGATNERGRGECAAVTARYRGFAEKVPHGSMNNLGQKAFVKLRRCMASGGGGRREEREEREEGRERVSTVSCEGGQKTSVKTEKWLVFIRNTRKWQKDLKT
jgi:hypothetical protein